MDHLSGLDAAFLHLETPETPLHVGSLSIYELPAEYAGDFTTDVCKHIQSRMHLAPIFQRKLAHAPFDLANPVWVMDEHGEVFSMPFEGIALYLPFILITYGQVYHNE